MPTHQLDLLANALDSLAEALAKLEAGDAGDPKAFKFAVLHMAHFVELIFKHHITEKHPLLIYKNPFAQKLDRNVTITLWDAINFIANEDEMVFSKDFRTDLEWLKRLRNEIEHHKFTMDVEQTRTTMGRLFRSVLAFLENHTEVEVRESIPEEALDTFQVLSDEYEFRLRDALKSADAIEAEHWSAPSDPESPPVRLNCNECGNSTLVLTDEASTGFRCIMCKNEYSDDIPASCDICGAPCALGDLVYWDNEIGQKEGRCYYCSGRYRADKDTE